MTARQLFGVDQFGERLGPLDPKAPKRSLLEEAGARSAVPMYRDYKDGRTVQSGYVVATPRGWASRWFSFHWETVEPWEKAR